MFTLAKYSDTIANNLLKVQYVRLMHSVWNCLS